MDKLVTFGPKNNNLTGGLPAVLDHLKKLQINVQGNKPIHLEEEMCKMKNFNDGLVGTFGCDAILFTWNNVNDECHPCLDGNSSNNLGSYRWDPNADTDNSESASFPTVIDETPSQYNTTKQRRSNTIQSQGGGGISGTTKAFIVLVGLTVPAIIIYALRGTYIHRNESKESIKSSIWMDPVWRLTLNLWSRAWNTYCL